MTVATLSIFTSALPLYIPGTKDSKDKLPSIYQYKTEKMGISMNNSNSGSSASHKAFLLCNYVLLGAASSCIFLALSLRLFPSLPGFFLILLHVFTVATAVFGCASVSSSRKWYGPHLVATVLSAILQGSVFVLIFTRTGDFLRSLRSYVREDDGAVILRLAGGLSALVFCLEWVVLTLAFVLKYNAAVEGDAGGIAMKRSAKVQDEEDLKNWPWPFQV